MKKFIVLVCWFIVFFICSRAFAVVNIEEVRPEHDETGFTGDIRLDFSGSLGNTEKINLGTSGSLVLNSKNCQDFLIAGYNLGKSSGVKDTDKLSVHLRHVQLLHIYLPTSVEFFSQIERDEFTRIEFRGLAGAGLRWEFFYRKNSWLFALGTGAFYSYEKIQELTGVVPGRREHDAKANIYLSLKRKILGRLTLISTVYYQPVFVDFHDFVLFNSTSLDFILHKSLSLIISLGLKYDNEPPEQVKRLDLSYLSGFRLKF